jgi:transcriptional regulator with XRE-family HTH domain
MRNAMPARPPAIIDATAKKLESLGRQIRAHRKALRVSATAAAEAAGMSRVTLHRIERGEPAVTMGAYLNAMAALGLEFGIVTPPNPASDVSDDHQKGWIPARIPLSHYPQLKQLAWQVHGTDELTPVEALDIYERKVRHLDFTAMEPGERHLIDALRLAFGEGCLHV